MSGLSARDLNSFCLLVQQCLQLTSRDAQPQKRHVEQHAIPGPGGFGSRTFSAYSYTLKHIPKLQI